LNALPWFRPAYYALGQPVLDGLIGNELSMQRRVNLSVQMPNDASSLLPFHSDVWAGDSPFEVVMWVPMVNCFGTKSMYLLPPDKAAEFNKVMSNFAIEGVEKATKSVKEDLKYIDVPYSHALIFNQCLPHGNVINSESETRWTFNCRFKSVFSPYADKKLGEFFSPITLRPASRVGLSYELPEGFSDGDE